MLRRAFVSLLLVLLAVPLVAQTYSMSPTAGPTTGGTVVTIKGDFPAGPYFAYFNDEPAASTTLLDAQTLVVVTPPHLPGPANVTIVRNGVLVVYIQVTFDFIGDVPAVFERVLLPVFTPPVYGAFGSEFHTALRIVNTGTDVVRVYGLSEPCQITCVGHGVGAYYVEKDQEVVPGQLELTGGPGRFLWIQKRTDLAMNLRVHDVTRSALNFGTEIPIVGEKDWVKNRVVLLGVPADPRFRKTLRIYGQEAMTVTVTVGDRAPVHIALSQPGGVYDVPYGVFGDFPEGSGTLRVTITSELENAPMWAMITVTNNETQVISTITPQP